MKIVIASAGRRAHYLEWFQDALRALGIRGEVIAMEYRSTAPGFGVADRAVTMPAYNSPEYGDAMRQWFADERPDAFFCMNDYESQVLSGELADDLRRSGAVVAVLAPDEQAMVLDKYAMAESFAAHGIPTPATSLGTEVDDVLASASAGTRFVVKHRFGSGSSGLELPTTEDLRAAVARSAGSALGPDGRPVDADPAAVVVQEFLPGDEYGLDGVFSLDGRSELLGVMARRVGQKRAGDTDVATTADPGRFRELVAQVGRLLLPSGSIDMDVREDGEGVARVIDINPRFGGGYPYCHQAGAQVPAALIRSVRGLEPDPALLDYEIGVTSTRREAFTVIGREGATSRDAALAETSLR
ncbi:ATP-grasp domain-containing protein [Agrococcus carbonis]|nr:ATP-grasp domain-containing protein [Agrococcus carbonis]